MGVSTSRKLLELGHKDFYYDGVKSEETWRYNPKATEKTPGINFNNKRAQIVQALEEDEMKEDTEQIDVGDASKGEYTQTPTQQQAPDGMGDGGDPGSRGMGIESIQTIDKKTIMEVAVSKAQKNFYCFVNGVLIHPSGEM